MKIGITADHAGYKQKEKLKLFLEKSDYHFTDFGAFSHDPDDDYSDIIIPLAEAISKGEIDKGIAICGSGVGVSIAANKFPGVRAALITETYSAHQGVEHDHMNLICVGGRVLGLSLITEIIDTFLKAEFVNDEPRFKRRLDKVIAIENKNFKKH
ncbi:RpiB/LacA/LacB family sugar-phosphate isomerase [Galbibacter sp. EGI 63066]|uniref:RpiB/LacA/LacB family sugar-phosphate isomerase n=1 Tax=Galbibacter sp. EGI 63066 TaxID=2993559 RepID=UPI002248CF51|nr:RpiB/LacA/LacB family sugar-phosphate isomerase [Galbibacter sp. EGI 63066]MCX2679127.1 RpiB/LacA/LacB family sugar-phosphate isomerase [Galbibacter sp. EGI 63066]